MILVVDSSALILLVNPSANPPSHPVTKEPVEHVRDRVLHLISSLTARDTIIIPAPVLAEALVQAGEGAPDFLASLGGLARIRTRPFDDRAAVETAIMTREAIAAGDKRAGSDAPWQKVKVDRQIIAIARVESATRIYSDDRNLVAFAKRLGMDVISTWDLPTPERERDLISILEENCAAENVTGSEGSPSKQLLLHAKRGIIDSVDDDLGSDGSASDHAI